MKKALLLVSLVATVFSSTAFSAPVNVGYIVCTGGQVGRGGMTVTFTGYKTFNITAVNAWGIPFMTQQAAVTEDPDFDGQTLTFNLKGQVSGTQFRLELYNGTREGKVSTDDGGYLNLACSSQINAR